MSMESKQAPPPPAGRGRPPFGYRMAQALGPSGSGRLEPDPETSTVVRRIFAEYLAGNSLQAIAAGLTADRVTRPSVHDRGRNPHHSGSAWSKGAVRGIIVNPRYTGRDGGAEDSADGLPPLISAEVFGGVQQLLSERGSAAKPVRDRHHAFRGLLRCALCRRLMQGTWNNNAPYYRCRVFLETADVERSDHPANIYLAENRVLRGVQQWFCDVASAPQVRLWIRAQSFVPGGRPERLDALTRALGLRRLDSGAQAAVFRELDTRLLYDPGRGTVRVRAGLLPGAPAFEGVLIVA